MTALSPKNFQVDATFKRSVNYVTPENGTTLEEVLAPEYWVHVARQMRAGSKIEVLAQDGSYYAELLVLSTENLSAKVDLLFSKVYEKTSVADIESDGHIIRFAGAVKLHQVLRKGKSGDETVVLQEGFRTKKEAQAYIDGQLQARRAS